MQPSVLIWYAFRWRGRSLSPTCQRTARTFRELLTERWSVCVRSFVYVCLAVEFKCQQSLTRIDVCLFKVRPVVFLPRGATLPGSFLSLGLASVLYPARSGFPLDFPVSSNLTKTCLWNVNDNLPPGVNVDAYGTPWWTGVDQDEVDTETEGVLKECSWLEGTDGYGGVPKTCTFIYIADIPSHHLSSWI